MLNPKQVSFSISLLAMSFVQHYITVQGQRGKKLLHPKKCYVALGSHLNFMHNSLIYCN